MRKNSAVWLVLAGVSMQFLVSGCKGGGSGLFGLFGGGGEILSALESGGGGGSGDGGSGDTGNGGGDSGGGLEGGGDGAPPVATVEHPEPASMALFGGGFAALSCVRRRKKTLKS